MHKMSDKLLIKTLTNINTTLEKLTDVLENKSTDRLTSNYKDVFDYYLTTYPENKDNYITLLNMYSGSYRRAVIAIECNRIKQETDDKVE